MTRRAWPDPQRVATAYHEAAHAVVAHCFGETVDLVTLHERGGLTMRDVPPEPYPAPSTMPRFFREPAAWYTEAVTIVIKLAGDIGAEMASPIGYVDTTESDGVVEQIRAVLGDGGPSPTLTPAQADRLQAAASGSGEGDEADAYFFGASVADDGAMYLVAWLRSVAQRLVWENRDAITRVAHALLLHRTLTGSQVNALVMATGSGGGSSPSNVIAPATSAPTARKTTKIRSGAL